MKEVSIQTMQRYLRMHRGKGVFLRRWHVDMKCYIVNENLADHSKPTIETEEARIACVPDIPESALITSGGHIYTGFRKFWVLFKHKCNTWKWRLKSGWFKLFYRIAKWGMK